MPITVNMSNVPPVEPLDLNHDVHDHVYWRSRTPAERWACVFELNRQKYGDVKMDRNNLVLHRLTIDEFNKLKEDEYLKELAESDRRLDSQ